MNQETINAIIGLAILAYNKKSKPAEFARLAAHKASLDAAKKYSPDLADFATLTAAASFYIEITDAINFSARVTDKSINLVHASNQYQAEWENYATTSLPKHITDNYFHTLAGAPEKISRAFEEAIAPSYDSTSVLDAAAKNKAKRAAQYVYLNTYCIARIAYTRALFIANRQKSIEEQNKVFIQTISLQLRKDLNYDVIDPGIFLKILSALVFRILTAIVFLIGAVGILVAIFHLTPIPFIPLICASSAGSAISLSVFIGGFFAVEKYNQIIEDNENRAEKALT
jgi:hypothetical protein